MCTKLQEFGDIGHYNLARIGYTRFRIICYGVICLEFDIALCIKFNAKTVHDSHNRQLPVSFPSASDLKRYM